MSEVVPLANGWVFDRCRSVTLPSGTVYEARTKRRDTGDGLPTGLVAVARTPDEAIANLQSACRLLTP
jgi:hypothetical protein